MKYLFIFLPFFAMAQGGDSTLYGIRVDIDSFRNASDTCWEIKDGWMSLKPGCVSIPYFNTSGSTSYTGFKEKTQEFYVSDRKSKAVESFKHAGAYYELRENGWYKEILPDTIPDYLNGDIRISGDSVFKFQKPGWIPCDQHIGKSESYQREKTDTSEVKLLVWTGCSLSEVGATKYLLYNETQVAKNTGGLAVYITETIKVDVIARYVSEDKWIKPSHVIKEL